MIDAAARQNRLRRILKVQKQKREIEEWSLTHLKREHAAIEQSDRDLIASLGAASDLHGLFIDAKVKGLRRNDISRRENEKKQDDGERRLTAAKRQERGVEKQYREAGREAAGQAEAKALDGHVEAFLAQLSHRLG